MSGAKKIETISIRCLYFTKFQVEDTQTLRSHQYVELHLLTNLGGGSSKRVHTLADRALGRTGNSSLEYCRSYHEVLDRSGSSVTCGYSSA